MTCSEIRSGIYVSIVDKMAVSDLPKRKYTAEEIINKLREVEVIIAAGSKVVEAARRICVWEQTFCRWRAEHGGLRVDQA